MVFAAWCVKGFAWREARASCCWQGRLVERLLAKELEALGAQEPWVRVLKTGPPAWS